MTTIELWRDSEGYLYTWVPQSDGDRPSGRDDDRLAWVVTDNEEWGGRTLREWGERTLRRAVTFGDEDGEIIAIEPTDGPEPWIGHTYDGERVYCGDPLVASLLDTNVEELWDSAHEGVPGPFRRGLMAVSVGRRILAGVRSLSERAYLAREVGSPSEPMRCSEYGDTDTRVPIVMGDDDTTRPRNMTGRRARLQGDLVMHITVGGRAEWYIDDDALLEVWPSGGGAPTTIRWRHVPWSWRERLTPRVVAELAAHYVTGPPSPDRW